MFSIFNAFAAAINESNAVVGIIINEPEISKMSTGNLKIRLLYIKVKTIPK